MPGKLFLCLLLRDSCTIEVDHAIFASPFPLLDFTANDCPLVIGTVLLQTPFLELTSILFLTDANELAGMLCREETLPRMEIVAFCQAIHNFLTGKAFADVQSFDL